VETKNYIKDRTLLFNLLEAHLFDKAVSVRKKSFELLKTLSPHILDIINPVGGIHLYNSVLMAITDTKPSIRKAAVEVIVPLTILYI